MNQSISPNLLDERAALGLTSHFVPRSSSQVASIVADFVRSGLRDSLSALEDSSASISQRISAGTALGILGDPRIHVLQPQLITVPEGDCLIGIDEAHIAKVADQWAHVGVIPQWIEKEAPRHRVHIATFQMMRFPVTNLEYREFLLDTSDEAIPSSWRFGSYPWYASNEPVWSIKYEAAERYARWLSKKTNRDFRLPSEYEWEYAASGGDGRQYPWGEEFDPHCANTAENGPMQTSPVGSFPTGRSPFGFEDMAGNVEEYTSDRYRPYPGGRLIDDDLHRATPFYQVARGGSFTRFGDLARCSRRHGAFDRPFYIMGFRLACTV